MISPDAIYIAKNIVYSWDYVFLQINLDIPDSLIYAGDHFYKKDEFHISLFCAEKYFPDTDPSYTQQLVVDAATSILKSINFQVQILNNQFYQAQYQDRKSILTLVEVSGLDNFLASLSAQLNIDIEPFPSHITLYTLANQKSVAINSNSDFQTYCRKINLDLPISPLYDEGTTKGR